jgi:hypothetical protein
LDFQKEESGRKSAADEAGERETQKRTRQANMCDAMEVKQKRKGRRK